MSTVNLELDGEEAALVLDGLYRLDERLRQAIIHKNVQWSRRLASVGQCMPASSQQTHERIIDGLSEDRERCRKLIDRLFLLAPGHTIPWRTP